MNYANQWNVKFSILETKNQKKTVPLLFKMYLSMKLLNFIKGTGVSPTGVLWQKCEADHSHQYHTTVMKQVDLPNTQSCTPFKLQASKEEAQQSSKSHSALVINTHPFQL